MQSLCQILRLPHPPRFGTGQRSSDAHHVNFPSGVESAPCFSPLHVPVTNGWEAQHPERDAINRNSSSSDRAVGTRGQCTEHHTMMLDLLSCCLLAPHTIPQISIGGQRCRLESQQVEHFRL